VDGIGKNAVERVQESECAFGTLWTSTQRLDARVWLKGSNGVELELWSPTCHELVPSPVELRTSWQRHACC
jgi:hypothetical protein